MPKACCQHHQMVSKSGRSPPCSTNDHRGDVLRVKGMDPGQDPASGGWVVVLLTHQVYCFSNRFTNLFPPSRQFFHQQIFLLESFLSYTILVIHLLISINKPSEKFKLMGVQDKINVDGGPLQGQLSLKSNSQQSRNI